jgi:putative transcriptional regulator
MTKYIRTNLASLRFARGKLSQREVSQATGIGQKTLSALETGASKGVEFSTLVRLCEFFKCELADLLAIEEEPEDIQPSQDAINRAQQIVARGLKVAIEAPPQTPAEIWAEFDAVRERLQKESGGIAARNKRHIRGA